MDTAPLSSLARAQQAALAVILAPECSPGQPALAKPTPVHGRSTVGESRPRQAAPDAGSWESTPGRGPGADQAGRIVAATAAAAALAAIAAEAAGAGPQSGADRADAADTGAGSGADGNAGAYAGTDPGCNGTSCAG